jgi:hypothetical protein
MATDGATSNLHMTMPDALKSKVRMPGVAGFGTIDSRLFFFVLREHIY